MAACQILGMTCNEIRDASVSSEAKGESPLDSIRMFSSYFDVIIMRASYPHFAEACAHLMNDLDRIHDSDRIGQRGVPIINGGSGADEHPTQALLDIYTMQRIFSFESKKDSSRRAALRRDPPQIPRPDQGAGRQGLLLLRRHRPRPDGALPGHAAVALRKRHHALHLTRLMPSSSCPPTCATTCWRAASASARATVSGKSSATSTCST